MRVFISWSGERSRVLAEALRAWLPTVIQAVEPWMSKSDLNKGTRWGVELAAELERTSVGIMCLTPDNLNSPWLLFEAGALSKTLPDTHVCPLLFHLSPTDIDGPLAQFQSTVIDEADLRSLMQTINAAQKEDALPIERLDKAFDLAWPELEAKLTQIPTVSTGESQGRSVNEMVREVLGIMRLQAREAESREDDFYRSRDSFMALMINLFQSAVPSANLPMDVARHFDDFSRYASAYYLNKRDISRCPDCQGTGFTFVPNKGVRRCEHPKMDEVLAGETSPDENPYP